jgi:hypothetical protein
MTDEFTRYEIGLEELLRRLDKGHPRHTEALSLQSRLLENIDKVRRYGDTETRRAERAQITDRLNHLTFETLGTDFNSITEAMQDSPPAQPFSSVQGIDNRSGGVYFEGEGSVQIQGDVVGGDQTKSIHKTHFRGPISDPVHTGDGDFGVGSMQVGANASLETLLDTLRQIIAANSSEVAQSRAMQQVNEMFRSILDDKPDLDLIESVLGWFQEYCPSLTDTIESAVLHPTVKRMIKSADEQTFAEFRHRFGKLGDEG